jgi:hypothetical protein
VCQQRLLAQAPELAFDLNSKLHQNVQNLPSG